MSNKNLFEVATRNKFRFAFKGQIGVEDLWQLKVEDLDTIYKGLNSQAKAAKEESLLDTKSKEDEELTDKIELIKYIFNAKVAEKNAAVEAKEKRQKKQKLMELLEAKKEMDLQGKSAEEIQAMIDELN